MGRRARRCRRLSTLPPCLSALVLFKPDAVRRGLVGNILSRFESKGLGIVAFELRTIDGVKADEHYAEHVERDFYPPLREFVTSGPLMACVLEVTKGPVGVVRAISGDDRRPQGRPRHSPRRPRCPAARTSCTAPARPSPPSARSRSGSPASEPPRRTGSSQSSGLHRPGRRESACPPRGSDAPTAARVLPGCHASRS